MNRLKSYFQSVGLRRFFGMLAGNYIIGIGCAVFKWSAMGNDPYSACGMALSDLTHIPYGPFIVLYNIAFFLMELSFGKEYIGLGTLVNWFGLGYFTQWTFDFLMRFGALGGFVPRVAAVFIGLIFCGLGLSWYQTSDTGISPYDSLPLIMSRYIKIPYFWCRVICDLSCALVCWIAGGILGLGTLTAVIFLGPCIHFFDIHMTEKLLKHSITESRTEKTQSAAAQKN